MVEALKTELGFFEKLFKAYAPSHRRSKLGCGYRHLIWCPSGMIPSDRQMASSDRGFLSGLMVYFPTALDLA